MYSWMKNLYSNLHYTTVPNVFHLVQGCYMDGCRHKREHWPLGCLRLQGTKHLQKGYCASKLLCVWMYALVWIDAFFFVWTFQPVCSGIWGRLRGYLAQFAWMVRDLERTTEGFLKDSIYISLVAFVWRSHSVSSALCGLGYNRGVFFYSYLSLLCRTILLVVDLRR